MTSIQLSNRLLPILSFGRYGPYITHTRWFHFSSVLINNTFKLEKLVIDMNKSNTKQILVLPKKTSIVPIIHSDTSLLSTILSSKYQLLWQRIIHELKHYYHGSKLLFIETKIAFHLIRQLFNGHTLTRRQRKQFTRTMIDLLRLIPFSIFIIVPFMEFTLPIFLKFFPNMLPSTFKQIDKEQENFKKQSSIKLEVMKFLQDTLEETITKRCSKTIQSSIEEIIQFSSLFANQLTLNNLHRSQLIALCKLLNLSIIGPNFYLRWKLHLKFHRLKLDDKLIANEGIENLTNEELRTACHERGINSLDITIEQLQLFLQQWIDLHINKHIPTTILLISQRLMNSNTRPTSICIDMDQLIDSKQYHEDINMNKMNNELYFN